MQTESEAIATLENGVGTISLNRPAALNALTPRMLDELIAIGGAFERDPGVRCVVLRGTGPHFMAGGDVKGFYRALSEDRDAVVARREQDVVRAHQFVYQLRRMPKPVVASVSGAAAGIGMSFLLACDLAIAADDAYFTLAYRHIGLSADGGATYFLPRIVGERKALEIALLGERFSAQTALELGVLNWIVPSARLEAETATLARRLADGPTIALGLAKGLIRASLDNSWDEQSHREAEALAAATATRDHVEGVTAFVEKRTPSFSGT